MAFLNFTLELSKTNILLERMAYALERIAGPDILTKLDSGKKRGPDSIVNYGNEEKAWVREIAQELIRSQGLSPKEEEELLLQTLAEYSESPGPSGDE